MKNIKFYFNNVKNGIPHTSENTPCRFYTDIKGKLNFDIACIDSFSFQSDTESFYVLDCTSLPLGEIEKLIPNYFNNSIKYYGLNVIVFFATEADMLPLVKKIIRPKLLTNRIFFITGDLLVSRDEGEKLWRNYSLDYFEHSFKEDISKNIAPKGRKYSPNYKNKNKDFLCLNGRNRIARFSLVSELYRNNLIEKSIFSYIGKGRSLDDSLYLLKKYLNTEEKLNYAYRLQARPLYKTLDQTTLSQDRASSQEWYDTTFFSLVTETICNDNQLFFTEKTWKPIVYGHPFILWHSKGALKDLRSRGYKTFPELFNEEYDNLPTAQRLECIIDSVKNFCSLDKDTKVEKLKSVTKKIIHNQNHFFRNKDTNGDKLAHIINLIIKELDK